MYFPSNEDKQKNSVEETNVSHIMNFNKSLQDCVTMKENIENKKYTNDKSEEFVMKHDQYPYKCTKCTKSFSEISRAQFHFETAHKSVENAKVQFIFLGI